jgi:hypothetical protein
MLGLPSGALGWRMWPCTVRTNGKTAHRVTDVEDPRLVRTKMAWSNRNMRQSFYRMLRFDRARFVSAIVLGRRTP